MYKDGFYFEERFLRSSSANRHCKLASAVYPTVFMEDFRFISGRK
jgi:hypothetical protein